LSLPPTLENNLHNTVASIFPWLRGFGRDKENPRVHKLEYTDVCKLISAYPEQSAVCQVVLQLRGTTLCTLPCWSLW